MFWDHGLGMGWMMVSWLVWLVIIVAVVWVATRAMSGGTRLDESPESILKRRYARGDIEREEYERRLSDIRK
jgi:putative membrane protein